MGMTANFLLNTYLYPQISSVLNPHQRSLFWSGMTLNEDSKLAKLQKTSDFGVLDLKGDICISPPRLRGHYQRGRSEGRVYKTEAEGECWECVFWMWHCLYTCTVSLTVVTCTLLAFSTLLCGSGKGSWATPPWAKDRGPWGKWCHPLQQFCHKLPLIQLLMETDHS